MPSTGKLALFLSRLSCGPLGPIGSTEYGFRRFGVFTDYAMPAAEFARALEGGCDSDRKTRRVDRSDLPADAFYSASAVPSRTQRAAPFVTLTTGRRSPAADPTVMLTSSCAVSPDAVRGRTRSSIGASHAFGVPEDADHLPRYRDRGIARIAVMLPSAGSDALRPTLDRWAEVIRRVRVERS